MALVFVSALLAATVGVLALPVPAGAQAQDFVSLINQLRTSKGLNPLAVDGNLTQLAQGHTREMAASSNLVHTPLLSTGVTSQWLKLGENVGYGGDTNAVWNAFVNSPTHLANLLDPGFNNVGVGVVIDGNGLLWTTHRFAQINSGGPPQPAPASEPQPQPAPTQPRPAPQPAPVVPPPTKPVPAPTVPPTTALPVTPVVPAPTPAPAIDPSSPAGRRVATMLDALHSRS